MGEKYRLQDSIRLNKLKINYINSDKLINANNNSFSLGKSDIGRRATGRGGCNGGAQRAPLPSWCCMTTHSLRNAADYRTATFFAVIEPFFEPFVSNWSVWVSLAPDHPPRKHACQKSHHRAAEGHGHIGNDEGRTVIVLVIIFHRLQTPVFSRSKKRPPERTLVAGRSKPSIVKRRDSL